MVPTRPLFASSTWKTLPRVRVLLLRQFGSHRSFAPAAVVRGTFRESGRVWQRDPLRTRRSVRADPLAQERRGSSCCVTGSLEFGSGSGGKGPLNATEIEFRAGF